MDASLLSGWVGGCLLVLGVSGWKSHSFEVVLGGNLVDLGVWCPGGCVLVVVCPGGNLVVSGVAGIDKKERDFRN